MCGTKLPATSGDSSGVVDVMHGSVHKVGYRETSVCAYGAPGMGPKLALVEGVIPNSIISNVTYAGFIVKYENN